MSEPDSKSPGTARASSVVLALALAGTAAAYGAAIDGDFHLDDWSSVLSNYRIRSMDRALEFTPLDLLGPGRPVTDLSFALDHAVSGLSPATYHVTSLVLHLATALLVFVLFRGALARAGHARGAPLAAIVAGAFALHPIQAGAVAYVAQRAEILAAFFGLASVLALLAAADGWRPLRAAALSLAAALLLALALGAKLVAVAYPFAFLLHRLALPGAPGDPTPLRARLSRALAVAAPSLVLVAASAARNHFLFPATGHPTGLATGALGPWRYLLTQLRVHWLYVRLIAWPAGLSVDHGDLSPSPSFPDAATIAAGAALLGLLGVAAWLWRAAGRRPDLGWGRAAAFGLCWWILLLAPTSSIVPIADLAFEHRTYLASAGLLLAAAVCVDAALLRLVHRRAGVTGLALALATLAALGAALAVRAQVWRSDRALWADAAAKSPGSFRPAMNLAWAEHEAGRTATALDGYRRAERLARTPSELAEVARNLAALHLDMGDARSALAAADLGIAARPGDAEIRNNRSIALAMLQRLDEAIAEARRAIALAPGDPNFRSTLGLHLLDDGRPSDAAEQFRAAFAIAPDELRFAEQALVTLGRAGRREEACAVAREVRARRGADLPEPLRSRAAALGCR